MKNRSHSLHDLSITSSSSKLRTSRGSRSAVCRRWHFSFLLLHRLRFQSSELKLHPISSARVPLIWGFVQLGLILMPMATAPLNKIERAHQMYREGLYVEALSFYTEALSMAKTKSQRIALHSNRAACHLKLHDFKTAAEECTWVLELDHKHTGALMLRAQTLVTLKEYHSALFDVNRLLELNPSSEVYQNLYTRLKTQLSLAPIPESEAELEEEEVEEEEEYDVEFDAYAAKEKCNEGKENVVAPSIAQVQKPEHNCNLTKNAIIQTTQGNGGLSGDGGNQKAEVKMTTKSEVVAPQVQSRKGTTDLDPKGWQTIPKPKGHSTLDYARWDRVEDDSSEDDDDEEEEESRPQFRFRVRTVGVKPVK